MNNQLVVKINQSGIFSLSYSNIVIEIMDDFSEEVKVMNRAGRLFERMWKDYGAPPASTPKYSIMNFETRQYVDLFEEYLEFETGKRLEFDYSLLVMNALVTFDSHKIVDYAFSGDPIAKITQFKQNLQGNITDVNFIDMLEIYQYGAYNFYEELSETLENKCRTFDSSERSNIVKSVKKHIKNEQPKQPPIVTNPQVGRDLHHQQEVEEMRDWFRSGFKDDFFKK